MMQLPLLRQVRQDLGAAQASMPDTSAPKASLPGQNIQAPEQHIRNQMKGADSTVAQEEEFRQDPMGEAEAAELQNKRQRRRASRWDQPGEQVGAEAASPSHTGQGALW